MKMRRFQPKAIAMVRRSTRGFIDIERVLPRLREGREGAIKVRGTAKVNSKEYEAAGEVLDAIDNLAELLTDDCRHFADPVATAGRQGWLGQAYMLTAVPRLIIILGQTTTSEHQATKCF